MSDQKADTSLEEQVASYVGKGKDAGAPTIGELYKVDRIPDQDFIHDVAVAVAGIQLGRRYATAEDMAQDRPGARAFPKAADILADVLTDPSRSALSRTPAKDSYTCWSTINS